MGLDMYLTGRRYLWSLDGHPDTKIEEKVKEIIPDFCGYRVKYIETEAAYWRKANAIHKWFVDNVQNGKDDCRSYNVDRKDLKKLIDTCKMVLENPDTADDLLPTQGGFFFGNQGYDDSYLIVLEDTVGQLSPLLDEKYNSWDFQYQSSW